MTARAPTATIPRKRRAARGGAADSPLSFESLRTEGLRLAQTLSGHTWTDYNLHDPGVTMLEQLCYALTDLVYRTDFPVADHLRAPRSAGIEYAKLSLHPPQDVFPCRATSAADYRRVLLDQVPGLDDATLAAGPPRDAGGVSLGELRGLYRLQLKLAQGVMTGADTRVADARTAYRARRTLCEDIDGRVSLMEDVLCNLRVDVELSGPRDPVDVLADIYARCARHLAQGLSFHSLDELLAEGLTLEQVYTGPVTEQGFAPHADEPAPELLFVSDLSLLVKGIDGVQEVRALSLLREGDTQHSSAMRWRGDTWSLRLRVPGLADARAPEAVRELLQQHVTLRRRGARLSVSPVELSHRLADLYAASRTRRRAAASSGTAPLPAGQYRDLRHYASVQDDFPLAYGLGRHGLPASASMQQKAQVVQLKSYLALFEQVIAHGTAQVEHLRDLYSAAAPRGPSYWWQMLDDSAVPGLDAIYRPPDDQPPGASPADVRSAVQAEVYESRDPHIERRSRAFDHLLALHGTTFTQNSMRQFCDYLSPGELELALIDNKAAFLQDIVALNRDRAAGLDYAKRSWGVPGSGTGLQRRVGHLLGFRQVHSRPLLQPFQQQRRTLHGVGPDRALGAETEPGTTRPLRPHLQPLARDEMRADLAAMPVLRGGLLSAAVLRCGLYRDRYRVRGEPHDQADVQPHGRAAAGPQQLVLGPDEAGRWWPLGEFATPEAASRAADSLRRFLMHLSFESEGLHVVEHVLLRPVGESPRHAALKDLPADFYALRLSAVFPSWTARCAQPNFQRLADETVQINCPAHVAARCLWLDHEAMATFETAYAEWLEAKVLFCEATASALDEASADPAAAARVNDAACRVIECLRPVWARSTEPGHA
jgi:hypothetical protein